MSAGYLAKCARKTKHKSRDAAEGHRKHLITIGRYTWSGSNTYPCNICGHWHVGRAEGTKFRGKAKSHRKGRKNRQDTQ